MAINFVTYQANLGGKTLGAVIARVIDFVNVAHVLPEAVGLFHVLVTDGALELGVGLIRVSPHVFGQCTLGLEALATLLADVLAKWPVVVPGLRMIVPKQGSFLCTFYFYTLRIIFSTGR